jgi:hypothetical protein
MCYTFKHHQCIKQPPYNPWFKIFLRLMFKPTMPQRNQNRDFVVCRGFCCVSSYSQTWQDMTSWKIRIYCVKLIEACSGYYCQHLLVGGGVIVFKYFMPHRLVFCSETVKKLCGEGVCTCISCIVVCLANENNCHGMLMFEVQSWYALTCGLCSSHKEQSGTK